MSFPHACMLHTNIKDFTTLKTKFCPTSQTVARLLKLMHSNFIIFKAVTKVWTVFHTHWLVTEIACSSTEHPPFIAFSHRHEINLMCNSLQWSSCGGKYSYISVYCSHFKCPNLPQNKNWIFIARSYKNSGLLLGPNCKYRPASIFYVDVKFDFSV
jgi:hypothetical protein